MTSNTILEHKEKQFFTGMQRLGSNLQEHTPHGMLLFKHWIWQAERGEGSLQDSHCPPMVDPRKALFFLSVPVPCVWLWEVQEVAGKQQQVLFGRVPAALTKWKLFFWCEFFTFSTKF